VQKRIDKVVAQKKSAEEELAEARAEIERLKAKVEAPEAPKPTQDDTPPTPEQVEAYIAKMSEEGNHKEVAAATRYLIKLEKELAMKEIEARQNETQTKAEAIKQKQLNDWANLSRDYVAYDENGAVDLKSDLNLSNQNGLLYKTALSLYNDKELHRDFYNDPDVIQGFRRAVSDAYREIHQQGLITPKGNTVVPRSPREVLADPSADTIEEPTQTTPNSLSDAEKVREEIKARSKNRFKR
jgi:beta-glucosidase-like glycosyl hydrolase